MAPLSYISLCSGIEASTVAWHPLGWKPVSFAEIEKFPSAVLAHHYPDVPNHGDFTTIEGDEYGAVDLVVAGTPCQDFSVAGLRAGMAGKRGQLTVEFANLAHRLAAKARTRWCVWENVPGVLSIDEGWAFAEFLGILAKRSVRVPDGGWANSGIIPGAADGFGLVYRVLDAQHFGVPQRRRRVFVVGYLGDWRRAAAVLFERHSLSWHPAPRREKGQVAPTIPSRSTGGGGLGSDFDCDGRLIESVCMSTGQSSAEIGIGIGTTLHCGHEAPIVTHALRGEGFDASEDGMGRGTPLVSVGFMPARTLAKDGEVDSRYAERDICDALHTGSGQGNKAPIIAFTSKDHGADAGDISPTLRSMGHDGSHANGGGQIAVMTLAIRGRGGEPTLEVREDGTSNAILTPNGGRGGIGVGAVAIGLDEEQNAVTDGFGTLKARMDGGGFEGSVMTPSMAVRRLTPRECERLQGFPDDYTKIPSYNSNRTGEFGGNRGVADGPRYKSLGNSMAVPCMVWIGQRIQMVEDLVHP